jgi:hypothetical protein
MNAVLFKRLAISNSPFDTQKVTINRCADEIKHWFRSQFWYVQRIDARGMDLQNPSVFARIVIETANSDVGSALKSAFNDYHLITERMDLRVVRADELEDWDVIITIYYAKAKKS